MYKYQTQTNSTNKIPFRQSTFIILVLSLSLPKGNYSKDNLPERVHGMKNVSISVRFSVNIYNNFTFFFAHHKTKSTNLYQLLMHRLEYLYRQVWFLSYFKWVFDIYRYTYIQLMVASVLYKIIHAHYTRAQMSYWRIFPQLSSVFRVITYSIMCTIVSNKKLGLSSFMTFIMEQWMWRYPVH